MANIGVCIEPFFSDLPYADRLGKVHELCFEFYEFWFHNMRFDGSNLIPEDKDFGELAELNERYGLTCTDFVFNHPDGGVVGAMIDKRDRALVLDSFGTMIELAKKIGCRAFISGAGNNVAGLSAEEAVENMIDTLKACAGPAEKAGVTLILEPFNTRVDHPDYFLDDPHTCVQVLKAVDSPNVKMLYDIYHMQIMDGNVVAFIRENIDHIGHFHVAGVPGRNEPYDCELNYPYILKEIDALGYSGGVGLEYWPTVDHEESLKRTMAYLEVE
jgi:hydroxypyruvate isomerase